MHIIRAAVLALAAAALVAPAQAQTYPERELKVIAGYPAGTGADIIIRYFAEKLRPLAGQPVIVENKGGALTAIGAEAVKNAKPDGYTMLITAGNATMATNPYLFKALKYDPVKDFTPVTTLLRLPFVLGVAPSSPVKSVKELIAHLKQKGDKASYGYSSAFGLSSSELFQSIAGTKAVGVSYKGTPDIMPDLLAGQLEFVFSDATFLMGQAKEGRLRILAVTYAKRSPLYPDLPGMEEAGVADFDLSAWFGVWLPAGAPQPVVDKLAGWFNQIVANPENQKEMASKLNVDAFPGNAKVLAELLPREMKKWGELVKLAKIEPQ